MYIGPNLYTTLTQRDKIIKTNPEIVEVLTALGIVKKIKNRKREKRVVRYFSLFLYH